VVVSYGHLAAPGSGRGIRSTTALRIRLEPATSCSALGQEVHVFIEELAPPCPFAGSAVKVRIPGDPELGVGAVAAVGQSRDAEGTPGPGDHQPGFGRIDGGERPGRMLAGRGAIAAQRQDGGGDHVSGRCLRLRPQLEQLAADLEGSGWSLVAVNAEAAEEAVDASKPRTSVGKVRRLRIA
jgi:hypothetical protein